MSISFINSMMLLVLTSRLFIRSCIFSATAVTLLSSAKLCKSEPSKKNMSFMNMLKNIGSSIVPCGMSNRINFKRLKLFVILTHCLRPLRYDSISFRILVSKPYASSFATSKSWGKQLKAFNRSVRVAPVFVKTFAPCFYHSQENMLTTILLPISRMEFRKYAFEV